MTRVLVVEDERDLQDVIGYNLRELGYDVAMTDQGSAVMTMVRAQRPDLVILDLMLPKLDGLEVCRLLKADITTKNIPVIFLAGYNFFKDEIQAFISSG